MLKKLISIAILFSTFTAFAAVEINKADIQSLQTIKGIGPGVSTKIIQEREKSAFKDWGDMVHRVKGIGAATASKLSQEGLTVNGIGYSHISTIPASTHKIIKKYPPADRY
jgi:competence protein ComEA